MKQFTVGKNEAGLRFDKYIKKILKSAPDSFVFKMLRKKNIELNGKKADGKEKIKEGDIVRFFLSDETFDKFAGSSDQNRFDYLNDQIILNKYADAFGQGMIFENEDYIVYNKPAGLLSQKAEPSDVSVNEYLIAYLYKKGFITPEELNTFVPSVCNRLDRNTTGIILCSKSISGARYLSEVLRDRSAHKEYRAVVHGNPSFDKDKETLVEGYLKRDKNGNVSIISSEDEGDNEVAFRTGFKKIGSYKYHNEEFSVLSVMLYTGKTHQIRAGLSSMGFPIAGDVKYDPDHKAHFSDIPDYPKHQLLHAYKITFPDGTSYTADPDDEYSAFLNRLFNNGNMEK